MSSKEPSRTWDAIVVGARCAGAATAMLLARAGLDVLVLDSGRAGSDTLSTHALMRGGVVQLHRWGLLESVAAAGSPAITRTDFHFGADPGESVDIRSSAGIPGLFAPRRQVLDAILVAAAERAGAVVRHGATVLDLVRNGKQIAGVRWQDRITRRVFSANAPLVIGADGRRSTIAELVDAPVRDRGSAASGYLLGYWPGLDRHTYQWFYERGATAGVVPTNDGLACVWVGMPAARFAERSGTEDLFGQVLAEAAPALRLSGTRHGPLRGFPGAPGFVREAGGPGWALVGDAGYFKDPITAHGMTDALRDAELLARAVLSAPDTERGRLAALQGYQERRDELSAPLRVLTERIACYDWDLTEIRELLSALSQAMRPEVQALLELDRAANNPAA